MSEHPPSIRMTVSLIERGHDCLVEKAEVCPEAETEAALAEAGAEAEARIEGREKDFFISTQSLEDAGTCIPLG